MEIGDLSSAGAVLGWDQATYMPKGGAAARARQGATLSRLAHEKFTDPALGRLLDGLAAYAEGLPYDSDDASLIRVVRRDYEKATKVPSDFVARWSEMGSASYDAWTRARPANDFATMRPYLEKALDFSREYAEYLGPYEHIADPLIDGPDEGMTVTSVRALFGELRAELVPIVRAIAEQPVADDSCLRGALSRGRSSSTSASIPIKRFGYDFERGRLDKTHHPFCTKFSARRRSHHDARQGERHRRGAVLHAARSRPCPLRAGRRRPLRRHAAGLRHLGRRAREPVAPVGERGRRAAAASGSTSIPQLRDAFPEQFGKVPLETFYRAINKVERSLIRTDADEVTYNLHVMLRFDLELDLLEGRLKVKDLPEAWRARFTADFGITPPDDRDGCLQDVHWYGGSVGGAFQGYTIGNILSAQFYAAAVKAHPEIPQEMTRGEFGTLHAWLRKRLYRHGRKFTPDEIVKRATGKPHDASPPTSPTCAASMGSFIDCRPPPRADSMGEAASLSSRGLVPGIQPSTSAGASGTWIPATSAGMTRVSIFV